MKVNSKNSKKKITKNNQVKKFGLKFPLIFLVVFLVIVALVTYSYVSFHKDYVSDVESVVLLGEEIKSQIPNQLIDDLDFSKFTNNNPNIVLEVKSKNELVISNLGKVYRPLYSEDDAVVELVLNIRIKPSSFLKNIYYQVLGFSDNSFTIKVKVLKQPATNQEKVDIVKELLFVPKVTSSDIGLTTEIHLFSDINITWESLNEDIITSNGVVKNTGTVTLLATIASGEISNEVEYLINVVDELSSITYIDLDLEDVETTTSYSKEYDVFGIKTKSTLIERKDNNTYFKMQAHNSASLLIEDVFSPKSLSFTYFAITDSAFSKNVNVNVFASNDNSLTWELISQTKVENNNEVAVSIDLSSLSGKFNFKIETSTEYSTMLIAIDNIKLIRNLAIIDIEDSFNKLLPNKVGSSIILPESTPYGGKVRWINSSDNELFNIQGIVNQKNLTEEVVLEAEISGVVGNFTYRYIVKVVGSDYVDQVEVYFIDLGKYGSSDTGEATYIKIGNIDILVDAGDNHNASKQAIREVIDEVSEDGIIDYIIATHPDADHIGGMKYIFDVYDVLNIIYFEGEHTTNIYRDFVQSMKNENLVSECTVLAAYNNQGNCSREINLASEVKIEIINTTYYESKEPNGRSIVFVLEAYGTRLLMTGDADNAGGRKIEEAYMGYVGDIDILKMVHHGTKEGTTSAFLNVVRPEVVIISNGNYFGNKHGHPTYEAINRVYGYSQNTAIYAVVGGDATECTSGTSYTCENIDRFVDRNGTIIITIDNNGYELSTHSGNEVIELSSTHFWKSHPHKEYSYSK